MANLKIKNLQKGFEGFSIIKGIDLEVNDKEFVVFVGPSGCGKSTLLRLIAGLEEVSGGTIELDGRDITEVSPAERDLAMVFQTYALYPHMTVKKNMSFALDLAGVPKAEVEKKVGEAARILELGPMLERKPKQLSGGQRQRVAIGRAIVRNPKIFLFDEPLSNLDAALRVQTRLEIAKLHKQLAATIVYVTHDQVEAMTLGDKIVVMHDGHIQQAGTPLELYQHPQNLFVAGFIGSPKMNFLPGLVTAVAEDGLEVAVTGGRKVRVDVVPGDTKVGDKVTLGLRAEHIHENSAGSEQFSGQVNLVEHLGEANFIYVTLSGGQDIVVRGDGNRNVDIGQEIVLSAHSNAFHVFDADGNALRRLKPGNLVSSRQH